MITFEINYRDGRKRLLTEAQFAREFPDGYADHLARQERHKQQQLATLMDQAFGSMPSERAPAQTAEPARPLGPAGTVIGYACYPEFPFVNRGELCTYAELAFESFQDVEVPCCWQHGEEIGLAELHVDDFGLFFIAELVDTPAGRRARQEANRGRLQCSLGFDFESAAGPHYAWGTSRTFLWPTPGTRGIREVSLCPEGAIAGTAAIKLLSPRAPFDDCQDARRREREKELLCAAVVHGYRDALVELHRVRHSRALARLCAAPPTPEPAPPPAGQLMLIDGRWRTVPL